ncbi:helix-turn-helix transcriptional regulator [Paenibacillus oenotherae]|uniref:Helix-turn-helix transcriptional regulator n=1 Tax=Paenibacillus oenotherae TaxID=1435645 RepID=A0ABS7D7V6_9BACL|nr:helix-turn-helix transcriptional regulator [Paenibacillus oenotherae]MBW7476027.1 helix-turn-helix transcriptional regulator [Paenibacillus oenotherae]
MTVFDSIFQIIKAPMAIMQSCGNELRFQCANPAFTKLVGCSETELRSKPPHQLFTAWNEGICYKEQGTTSCLLNQNLSSRQIQLRLTWQSIEDAEQPSHLLVAEDISAKAWITMMSQSQNVMISGVTNSDFIIHQVDQNYPLPMISGDIVVERQSAFSFVEESEKERIMQTIGRAVEQKQAESLIVQTNRIADVCQLEVHVTICPFFNGDGSLEQYGFVVSDLRPIPDKNDPSVTLKILMARHNISTQQLSEVTGISQQTISKLRNGKIRKPQRLTAELIAAELLVAPQQIWP